MKDPFKKQIAEGLAAGFRDAYPVIFIAKPDLPIWSADYLYNNIERTKDPKMGRYTYPVFRWVRELNDSAVVISSKVSKACENYLLAKYGEFKK